jgi:hypothetical protein
VGRIQGFGVLKQVVYIVTSSVTISITTDTTTTATLLFLLSIHILILYFSFQLTSGVGVMWIREVMYIILVPATEHGYFAAS